MKTGAKITNFFYNNRQMTIFVKCVSSIGHAIFFVIK